MTDELEQMTPNQRRALGKALSALEAMSSIWAAEIRLSEISAGIAALPDEADRAKRIAAMIEQGFIEGAYRHYLDHRDKCDELAILQAATPTGTTMTIDIINSAADATMSPDEREAFDKFSDDTKQRLLNQILKRAATHDAPRITYAMVTEGVKAMLGCTLSELESTSPKLLERYEAEVTRVFEAMSADRGS